MYQINEKSCAIEEGDNLSCPTELEREIEKPECPTCTEYPDGCLLCYPPSKQEVNR